MEIAASVAHENKLCTRGVHRVCEPEATLDRIRGVLRPMGITRIANVTGLDRVGVPVVMVARPNARSLAVTQGKGPTLAAAKASGVMEAIESYHGEHILRPLKYASFDELRFTHRVVDPLALPQLTTSCFHPDLVLPWVGAVDFASEEEVWVPFEMVHTNFTVPITATSGCFAMGSNGQASGNTYLEAVSHGVSEVIERDSTSLWHALDPISQLDTRIDLETIDDQLCLETLQSFSKAGLGCVVWETTSDIGVPSFLCSIVDEARNISASYTSSGMGCHPCREIALLRALTEAAQSRLTLISGARDDSPRHRYSEAQDCDDLSRNVHEISSDQAGRSFRDCPTFESVYIDEDVSWLLERLRSIGLADVLVVDLTRQEFQIPVVRVIIPGVEGSHESPGYRPGKRALSGACS